jgi:lysozyme family protein
MNTRAEVCIPRILKHEGGYVNNPNDKGGPTNKGITLATFRRYIKPDGGIEDLKNLRTEQAVVVYKRQYWDAVLADMLPLGLDYTVADFAVNSGPSRSAKFLQKIVGVKQDGKIGPKTLAAVRARNAVNLINELNQDRMEFLMGLKDWEHFGRGWQRRVNEVNETSLEDADSFVRPDMGQIEEKETKKTGNTSLIAAVAAGIGALIAWLWDKIGG